MMLFFFMSGAAGEKYHPKCGHETTYTIALGLIISIIFWYAFGGPKNRPDAHMISNSFQFESSFFFDFLLPPLVFSSGYTMHKKKFFDNLGNISLNGFFVTIVCFVIYGACTIVMVNSGMNMTNYNDQNKGVSPSVELIAFTPLQGLLFAGLLCSSDVVAAVSIVNYEQ